MPLHRSTFALALLAPAALLGGGCTKYSGQDAPQVSLGREDADYMVLIAVDLSGSFADQMTSGGKAYEFTMRVADGYFRNSVGTGNRVIIAQLSATDRA